MAKILMLDLEGVLIATAITKPEKDYGIRPYSDKFMKEIPPLFNQVYLNTCFPKDRVLMIMKEQFAVTGILYYDWDRSSLLTKTSGYEQFSGDKLVHVEDGSIEGKEAKTIIQLGHNHISVPSWTIQQAYSENIQDKALLDVMERIRQVIL